MEDSHLLVRREGRVAWVEYNRPPVNVVDWETLRAIPRVLSGLLADDQVRVIVIGSAVEGYFSVGADLTLFRGLGPQGMREWMTLCHDVVRTMRQSPKPLLAAIRGTAVGAGFEVTLHCDLRFASQDSRLGQPEVEIGVIPGVGTTQALVRLLGRSRALRLLYEATLVSAREAHEMGLIDFVCPPERLLHDVRQYATSVAGKPTHCLAAIRRTITIGGGLTFDEGLRVEFDAEVGLAGTPDFAEGVAAFLEKRIPRWA